MRKEIKRPAVRECAVKNIREKFSKMLNQIEALKDGVDATKLNEVRKKTEVREYHNQSVKISLKSSAWSYFNSLFITFVLELL